MKQLFIIVISCAIAACAGSTEQLDTVSDEESSGRNDCIHEPSIRGYTVLDEQNLIIEASGNRAYHVVLDRRARDLDRSHGIWFKTTTSRICARFDSIEYDGSLGINRIASIRELEKEEEEHLLIRFGKREPEIKQTPAPQEVEGAEVEELDGGAGE